MWSIGCEIVVRCCNDLNFSHLITKYYHSLLNKCEILKFQNTNKAPTKNTNNKTIPNLSLCASTSYRIAANT